MAQQTQTALYLMPLEICNFIPEWCKIDRDMFLQIRQAAEHSEKGGKVWLQDGLKE